MASGGSLQELVATAASLHPHRTAVTFDTGSASVAPVSLTYSELSELAAELSQILQKSCTSSDAVIGLYCKDDLLIPVWILGILQTPAAYGPLDPDAPGLLLARVITRCHLWICLVKSDILQRFQSALVNHMAVEICATLPKFKLTLVRVKSLSVAEQEQAAEHTAAQRADNLCTFERADVAYVLHTSGTTGQPKSVRVPHRCILPNILQLRSLFQVNPADLVFLASPLTFDPSVVDIFLALSSGAQLLIIPAVIKKIPSRLVQLLFNNHKTTIMQVTPTLLGRFGPDVLKQKVLSSGSSLRVLALGGETCPSVDLLNSWRHESNQTRIYNIYGTTEVSCWACCYEIPISQLQHSDTAVSAVPLGTPLVDTLVEVRDENGCVITEGEGQVFIGGADRVCLLDGEDTVIPGTMRATGDWVSVSGSQLFYLGRTDRTIKRHGQRVNLDNLQQLIVSLPEVEACAACVHEARLLAFVVTSASGSHGDVSQLILKKASLVLPSYSVPDTLLLVPALALTPHGKVDMQALVKTYQSQRRHFHADSSLTDATKLKQSLQTLWKDALSLDDKAAFHEESNFLFSGGDSLKALRLCEDILATTGVSPPRLLEVVLDGTFSDMVSLIATATAPPESAQPPAGKRRVETSPTSAKRDRRVAEECEQREALTVVRRAGEVTELARGAGQKGASQVSGGGDRSGDASLTLGLSLSWSSDTGRCVDASPVLLVKEGLDGPRATVFIGSHSHRVQALELHSGSLVWERVLGDRVEASAAVTRCGRLVVIGCYDSCVYFLCTASGKTQWTFKTGDAVKSSAAVDPITGLVMVGSHDGHVYGLDPDIRQCVWKCHCGGGAVFSSPYLHTSHRELYVATLKGNMLCLNPDSGEVLWSHLRDVPFFSSPSGFPGHVVIGSVDGNICCFSNTGKLIRQCVWKCHCGGGAVFSSPYLHTSHRELYVATLKGNMLCLNPDSGEVLWSHLRDVPFFSSPSGFPGHVVIGSVDGNICCFSNTGKLLWQFLTKGPVFSSPCVTPDQRRVLCGSHDGHLYCLNCSDGSLLWTFQASGRVYSSPFAFGGSALGRRGTLVGVASTDGTLYILDAHDGQMLTSHALPGELFSSAVVHERSVVIGCRNDYVYCLNLSVREET